jgi:hypothetical protein
MVEVRWRWGCRRRRRRKGERCSLVRSHYFLVDRNLLLIREDVVNQDSLSLLEMQGGRCSLLS